MPIPYLIQKIVYFPFRLIFIFFLHLRVRGQENCRRLKGPLIIAVNHKDYTDGVILVLSLPFWSRLFPVHSLIWHEIYYIPILHFFIKITGNMPVAKAKNGDIGSALKAPLKVLEEKKVVAIYPEGRMVRRENDFEKGRRGVAYLALKTGAQILPVSIKGTAGASHFWNFVLRKNKVLVNIGKPFSLPGDLLYNNVDDLTKGSDMVMNKIKELYYED